LAFKNETLLLDKIVMNKNRSFISIEAVVHLRKL